MRMLLKVTIPAEKGNEAFKSGVLQRTMRSAMEMLKAEAAYFYPENGKRTAIMVFDMESSSQLVPMLEPMYRDLDAAVQVTPVMNAEDLQRGFQAASV